MIFLTPIGDKYHIKLISLDSTEKKESKINKEIYNEIKKYIISSYTNPTGEILIISKKSFNDIFNKLAISHVCKCR